MTGTVFGFKGDYFFLSNFFVEADGLTAEHRFQAAKTTDPVWRERILSAPTPSKAKYHGRSCPLRPDWEDVKTEVMEEIVRAKFADPALRDKLLATGDAELIEANHWGDTFWGVDEKTGVGKNWLGAILKWTRETLHREHIEQSFRDARRAISERTGTVSLASLDDVGTAHRVTMPVDEYVRLAAAVTPRFPSRDELAKKLVASEGIWGWAELDEFDRVPYFRMADMLLGDQAAE